MMFGGDAQKEVFLTDRKNAERKYHFLLRNQVFLGSKEDLCDVVIRGDPAVSRRHCRIYQEKGRVFVQDERSTNGTYVNRNLLKEQEPAEVRTGDALRFGDSEFFLEIRE